MGPQDFSQLPPELMMSPEEMDEMMKFLSTLDEKELQELERIGRQVLTDMGINPDTLEPIPGGPEGALPPVETKPAPGALEKKQAPEQAVPVTPEMVESTKQLTRDLLAQTYKIYQFLLEQPQGDVAPLLALCDDIIYYLRVIDTPHLIERISQTPHQPLVGTLRTLLSQLALIALPQPPQSTVIDLDSPYAILEVSYQATQEDIDAAYHKRMETLNLDTITSELNNAGLPERDIKRVLKETQRTINLIKDAYEALSDKLTRERIDQDRISKTTLSQEYLSVAYATVEKIATLLQSLNTQEVTKRLETFLGSYAPEQLAQKKKIEDAEKARLREQEALARITPRTSPGGGYERPGRYEMPSYGRDSFGGPSHGQQFPSWGGDKNIPGAGTDTGGKKPFGEDGKGKAAGGKPFVKPEDKEKDKKEEEEKKQDKKPSDKKKEGKKETKETKKKKEKTPQELFKDCIKSFATLQKAYDEPTKKLLAELPVYTHEATSQEEPAKSATTIQADELPVQLALFIEKSALVDLKNDLEDLAEKLKKDQLAIFKSVAEVNEWKKLLPEIQKLTKEIGERLNATVQETLEEKPLNVSRMKSPLFTIGKTDEPGIINVFQEALESTNKSLDVCMKVFFPEKSKEVKKE